MEGRMMRMKTDDVVRSFVKPGPSSIEPGARGRPGGGVLGSGDARIVGPGYVWLYSRRKPRKGRQAAAIIEAAEALH
ncbi:unnamed protein product [Sphagnum troendelagicum]|uniref:Uncharacterized protein n=1 Tax=Sphagnum troendelagicum TaxID=128251 RepID=A0ABP0V2V4_9BRYO